MLQKMVPNLFKSAGIDGYYTNHSLKATTATCLRQGLMNSLLSKELDIPAQLLGLINGLAKSCGHSPQMFLIILFMVLIMC